MSECMKHPYSDTLNQIKEIQNPRYQTFNYEYRDVPKNYDSKINLPNRDLSNNIVYDLILCDAACEEQIRFKSTGLERPNPFINKKNINLEESKEFTNRNYLLLYVWFIIMLIVIYVLVITIVSENSYHPLMNVIIFIFLFYSFYNIFSNLLF